MLLGFVWSEFREWGSFALTAATLGFVAYDLWWVRRPRLRADLRTYKESDRLDIRLLNRGAGQTSITEVLFVHEGRRPTAWAPGTDVLPAMLPGFGAVEWQVDLEHAGGRDGARLITRTTAGDRVFEIPQPGEPVRGARGTRWA
ncbi:MAG: hypothetical protein H0T94_13555 [Acidimicrobiia bacterium]|nr:hypothetical protein [Acidimicrobiia bacterium]MDQ3499756.1 hypothetical protein [Actinomycetota bacterium]